MGIEEFYQQNLKSQLASVESLINECYSLQFSVRMIASLLLYKPDNLCSLTQSGSKELEFNALEDIESVSLIRCLRISLCKLNDKVKAAISQEITNVLEFPMSCSRNLKDESILLLRSLDESLYILDDLKSYHTRLKSSGCFLVQTADDNSKNS